MVCGLEIECTIQWGWRRLDDVKTAPLRPKVDFPHLKWVELDSGESHWIKCAGVTLNNVKKVRRNREGRHRQKWKSLPF